MSQVLISIVTGIKGAMEEGNYNNDKIIIHSHYLYFYIITRGPWTATPALIKVKETGHINKHFTCKTYSKLVQFYQNTHSVGTFLAPKALFLPPF